MTVPTIFETCRPRPDVLSGAVTEADFAADLAQVIVGEGSADYVDPARFFRNTYPTRGLKSLLANVLARLSGAGGEAACIFRLDTSYGGGKSHGLIALCHAARAGSTVQGIDEFVDPALLPEGTVRVAAFDGENADPANGRRMDEDCLAHTPWGEIAFALAGREGFERVRKSDESGVAPGAATLRELFGDEPTLILLDELSVYLRKAKALGSGRQQLTAFLTSLFKAVESTPKAAVVYTLAIGKGGEATDAYSDENQFIAGAMAEAASVSARKATLLNPTEEDETVQVLRRRLFEPIDEKAAGAVADVYRERWNDHKDVLPQLATRPEAGDEFKASYPFHPEVLETLTSKTATLENFQRVRGMLRLLARTVAHLWETKPGDATAIHLHHLDPGHGPVRQEIVTRLEQQAFEPAISNDVSGTQDGKLALAQEIDAEHHGGMPPYASYVARTIFMHTLAFNDPLKGLAADRLRYSILGPQADISFIDEARKKFVTDSAYLDDRPGAPMRFLVEANLTQIIRRTEENIDSGDERTELNDRIREIFAGKTLDAVLFPGGPYDVADEVADGRPKLVVPAYEAVDVGASVDEVPDLIARIYERKGSEGSQLRRFRNNLIFVVAERARTGDMTGKTRRRLALREMRKPDRLRELAEHQQEQVRELEARSEHELAVAIQQCYRHVFYPSRNRVGRNNVDLAHTAIDRQSTSDKPGAGQRQVVRALRELNKLRLTEDEPDSPAYVRDRTPLKKGQLTTLALRDEFRLDPALPILVGNDVFIRGIRRGIEQGEYVYRRGDLLCGPGDPSVMIQIDEQSMILTMAHAKNSGVWPRKSQEPDGPGDTEKPEEEEKPKPDPNGTGTDGELVAEGVLPQAVARIWEQARKKKAGAIDTLTVQVFEAEGGFRLLGGAGSISGADKTVKINGSYETADGGSFTLEFTGPASDADPVREFLGPQLRGAKSSSIEVSVALTFEGGLPMDGDDTDKLTKQLVRFAKSAEAHVTATTKAKA